MDFDLTKKMRFLPLATLLLAALSSPAQLVWSSYDKNGNLVAANVASGGDSTYGGSVALTIPAATQLEFVTKTFAPMNTPSAGNSALVTFNIAASGAMTGRCFGYGLFHDSGTLAQAMGYWGDFNIAGPYFECFQRNWTNVTYMYYDSGNALNSSKSNTGTPVAGTTYAGQIQVNNKSGSMQMGTSSSTVAAAGLVCNGSGVTQQSYASTPKYGTNVNVTTFNEFAVMFYNSTASTVTLTLSGVSLVPPNPVITAGPLPYSGSPGDNTPSTDFAVTLSASSATPQVFQWYQATATATNALVDGLNANGTSIYGSATASLSFTNAHSADTAGYFVVITNAYGAVTSSPAFLNIGSSSAPVITALAFTNATIVAGNNTNQTVTATGSPTPVFYWFDNDNNLLQSSTSPSLALTNVQYSQLGTYSIIASNSLGTATNTFALNVIVPPSISSQPTNLLLNLGGPAAFAVTASGVPAPTYQWYLGNLAISGATNASFAIASVVLTNTGVYKVVVANAAGSITSSNAVLAVNSTITGAPLSPANNATGICYDTPLYITFSQPVLEGNTGKIRIYNTANPTTPVDTLDLGANNVLGVQGHSLFSGDSQVVNYFPIITSGNTAAIYPHGGVLTNNQTYYVTMDPGVVTDVNGAYFTGISATNGWQFTTKATGPANPTNLVVAADGSGDFLTVQGAVDSIAPGNTNYCVINVRNGNYVEIVDISGKNNITFRGQSRTGTLVGYPNNNSLTPTTAGRMAFKVNASDIKLENLTITNGTVQGGSQAEALLIYNSGLRCIVNNCDILSRQDTILINASASQGYFYNCRIVGNFDYVWGSGVGYFDTCVLHTLTNTLSGSYNLTAARTQTSSSYSTNTPWLNPNGTTYSANGLSFVNCTIEADAGVSNITLSDSNGTAGGLDAWVNCRMDINAYATPSVALSNSYVFWQNNNLDITGTSNISFANVQTIGVTNNDPRLLAATNIIAWFYGWAPRMAPNITSQPSAASVTAGQSASFAVGATGLPSPAYQWLFNGAPIAGATSATYPITSAVRTNGGSYSVVVSNASGSVTSAVAVLTYANTAPVAAPVSFTRNASVHQLNINIPNLLTYVTDVDGDPISLVSVGVSTNGITPVISGNSIVYYSTSAVSDQFNYTVTDGFGGTSSAAITVNLDTQTLFGQSSPNITTVGSSAVIGFAGIPGYSYSVQRSTSVTFDPYEIIWTTNAPATGVFQFIDANPPQPTAFYRLQYNNP
jgi:hypothetical protein